MGNIYGTLAEESMMDIFISLGGVFEKLNKSCIAMHNIVKEDIKKFFHYYEYEQKSISDLFEKANEQKLLLLGTERKLRERKDELFISKQITHWNLDSKCQVSIDSLLHNKREAFKEMLPKETEISWNTRVYYGYFLNKIMEEYMRINQKQENEIKSHCLSLSKKCCDVFEEINVMWADLVAHFTNVQDEFDPNDEKIRKAYEEMPPIFFKERIKEVLANLKTIPK